MNNVTTSYARYGIPRVICRLTYSLIHTNFTQQWTYKYYDLIRTLWYVSLTGRIDIIRHYHTVLQAICSCYAVIHSLVVATTIKPLYRLNSHLSH